VASAMERALHAAHVGGTARELPLDTTGAISRTEPS
jgi:hypothetical protein